MMGGAILVRLSPDVLLVNETGLELRLLVGKDFEREISLPDNEREGSNVTPIIRRNEVRPSLSSENNSVTGMRHISSCFCLAGVKCNCCIHI